MREIGQATQRPNPFAIIAEALADRAANLRGLDAHTDKLAQVRELLALIHDCAGFTVEVDVLAPDYDGSRRAYVMVVSDGQALQHVELHQPTDGRWMFRRDALSPLVATLAARLECGRLNAEVDREEVSVVD